ncbi:MAG: polyprenyl synthetase family protein [Candidatus Omnitrophota bacterium]
MFKSLKSRIDKELPSFIHDIQTRYSLNNISPLLSKSIKDFVLRDGKRIRPILFAIGYLGYAAKAAPGLIRSALSIELLHDFMLVHDDIIDKSDTRRGKPSLHTLFNKHISRYRGIKFSGQDLAIVAGDIMYAMAIDAFLSIKVGMRYKEKALKKFIAAAVNTGAGEFIELLGGLKDIRDIRLKDIYKVYDYKTASYTFATPLATGAILAGAPQNQTDNLYSYGICLGRAFQIKDDLLGIFGDEKKTGKSTLTDLQEAKKTLLIWHAYSNSGNKVRKTIHNILSRKTVSKKDLCRMRKIITETGSLEFTKREILRLVKKSEAIISNTSMKRNYMEALLSWSDKLLNH